MARSPPSRRGAIPACRRRGGRSFGDILRGGVRLALLGIAVNLLALPLYFLLPGLNLVVFYGLNGWLLGREYFELVALRRLDERQLRAVWRAHWPLPLAGGVVIAMLLTVPVVNFAAPLVAAIFMLHLFERMQQRASENPVAALTIPKAISHFNNIRSNKGVHLSHCST